MRECYEKELLPYALSIGITRSEFWHLTMRQYMTHRKAYEIKLKNDDNIAWRNNMYTLRAVAVAVEHILNGNKAKSKYFEKPLLEQLEEEGKLETEMMTESEKIAKTQAFFNNLEIMMANFNLNHSENNQDGRG